MSERFSTARAKKKIIPKRQHIMGRSADWALFSIHMARRSGIVMPQRDLHDSEHFVRQCSRQKQVRSESDELLGVTAAAFMLRTEAGEAYLSGALLECVSGTIADQLKRVCSFWQTHRSVRPNCALAVCNAGAIRERGQRRARKLRVRHEPKKENEAYATLRGLPLDNSDVDLLELLAAESVIACCLVKNLPA